MGKLYKSAFNQENALVGVFSVIVKPWSPGVWAGVCEAAGWGGGLGPTGEGRGCELSRGSVVTEPYYSTSTSHPGTPINTRDANHPSVFTITEKAPTRALSWLKTLKTLLRHYSCLKKKLLRLKTLCKTGVNPQ